MEKRKPIVRMRSLARIAAAAAIACATGTGAADLAKGRDVYNFRCYFCHGYSGNARTLASTYLRVKPRDFQSADPSQLSLERIAGRVREGVPGTAMKGFRGVLTEAEIADVAAFVRDEFVEKRAPNTRYHTEENGWPDHERYAAAFPFARGEIALDADPATLDARQREGRRLFLSACVTCHDRARVNDAGPAWQAVGPR
jgi:cytochrome c oxidase cbb3-type subunit 3